MTIVNNLESLQAGLGAKEHTDISSSVGYANECYLMLKDTPVLYFCLEEMEVRVIAPHLLPFSLRGVIREIDMSIHATQMAKIVASNIKHVEEYLSGRVLSLERANAKAICHLYNLQQSQSQKNRVTICLMCRGVSIQDNYWIRGVTEDIKWQDVNIRENHFADIVSVALEGKDLTITTSNIKPELTTKGLFCKAWVRRNGVLYLLKSDKSEKQINTRMEVLASDILQTSRNLQFVEYKGEYRDGKYVSTCSCFAGGSFNFVEAREVYEYLLHTGQDMESIFYDSRFATALANITAVDYVLANTDRHEENFGFRTAADFIEIEVVAPIYDFNMCLVSDVLGNDVRECLSQMIPNKTITIHDLCIKHLCRTTVRFDKDQFMRLYTKYKQYEGVLNRVYSRISDLSLWSK